VEKRGHWKAALPLVARVPSVAELRQLTAWQIHITKAYCTVLAKYTTQ